MNEVIRRRLNDTDAVDSSSGSDSSFGPKSLKKYNFPQPHSEAYNDVLIDKHEQLMEVLTLENTIIIDKLTQDSVLSENEAISLRKEKHEKDKVRRLLLTLTDRGLSAFNSFIESLQEEYPHLSKELANSLEGVEKLQTLEKACVVCRIQRSVHFKDVIDKLYQKRILTTKDMKMILNCTDESGWRQLRQKLFKSTEATNALVDALHKKYPELAREYSAMPSHKFACFCKALRRNDKPSTNLTTCEQSSSSSLLTDASSSSSNSSPRHSFRKREVEQVEADSTTDITDLPINELHDVHSVMEEEGVVDPIPFQNQYKRRKHSSEMNLHCIQPDLTLTRNNSLPHTLTRICMSLERDSLQEDEEKHEGIYDNNIPLMPREKPMQREKIEEEKMKLHRRGVVRRKKKRPFSEN